MALQQIDHIALTCAAPEKSKEWYIRVLGFEHVHRGQWGGEPIFLRLGSTAIALFPLKDCDGPASSRGPRLHHFALRAETREEFVAARKQLELLGIQVHFQDHEIAHSIYFLDPDGHQLEITTYDVANQM